MIRGFMVLADHTDILAQIDGINLLIPQARRKVGATLRRLCEWNKAQKMDWKVGGGQWLYPC
jgi:hypothetical protein